MKKQITFLLTALMLIASANVFADFTEGGVTYTTLSSYEAKAIAIAEAETIAIPALVKNHTYRVIAIAPGLFNNSTVNTIVIDASYISELPVLCSNCPNLDQVWIREGNENLIVHAGWLSDCPKLNVVRFPKARLIYTGAIQNCPRLMQVIFDDVSVLSYQTIDSRCTGANYITWESDVQTLKFRDKNGNEVDMNGTTLTNPFGNIRTQITKIDLNGKYVPDQLFRGFTSLTKLSMTAQLEEIGKYAFHGCTSLTNWNPYDAPSLKEIGDYAFYACPITTNLSFTEARNPFFRTVGAHAFDGYSGTSVSIYGYLTIGDGAFANSPALESLHIEGYVQGISASAFNNCPSLKTLSMDVKNNWSQTYSSYGPFANKSNLSTVSLSGSFTAPDYLFAGSGVKTADIKCSGGISQYTFYNTRNLATVTWDVASPSTSFSFSPFDLSPITTLTIGTSVTRLAKNLFKDISSLKTITSNAVNPPALGSDVFAGCNNGNLRGIALTVPAGSESQYKAAKGWCEFYGTCGGDEGVDEVQGDKVQCTKVIENGQLYILRDGKVFNLQGAQVK